MSAALLQPEKATLNGTAEELRGYVQSLEARLQDLETQMRELRERVPESRVSIVVMSGDLDRVLAAFVIATGAAAMGFQVSMFFTFWGLSALRQNRKLRGKRWLEKAFTLLTPVGAENLALSKLNFAGLGKMLLRKQMRDRQVSSLSELMQLARDLGVRFVACQMSMDVMGITAEELLPGVETGGVATFLADAAKSQVTLFI
ncbi:MAG: DsrE/DsrF/DrsH-like family protein [Gemmatales bacterium]|nr:DsrE/DsrF/DrsH-like family protein [Gemmatales bacterium]MDW8223364.1 DsrE/DsrF/DrsH-like family protein [Gemmatales bacterium]